MPYAKPLSLSFHRRLLPVCVSLALFGALPAMGQQSATPSVQSSQQYQFNLAAGTLAGGLNSLARQAGLTVSVDSSLVAGKRATAVSGQLTAQQALNTLLSGTGLAGQVDGSVILITQLPESGERTLDPLSVTAQGYAEQLNNPSEGTGSYNVPGPMNTATRLGLSVRETPQSVTVVTRQVMDDMGLESITEVVNATNGVNAKSFDSSRSGFSARGFAIDNLQIDGVPTTWATGWSAGESLTDTLLYDRVEVVRGATGLIAGAGNPSAAINLIRKRADSDVFTGQVSLSGGSWDRYQGALDLSSPLNESGTVRGRVVGSYLNQHSYTDLLKNEKSVLYGTLAVDVTADTLFNVGASYQDNNPSGSTWGGLPIWFSDGSRTDWDRSKTTAADWSRWATAQTNYFANIEHLFDSGLRVYGAYSKSINDADLALLFLSGAPDKQTGEGLRASPAWYEVKREQDNLDLYMSMPFEAAGQSHDLTLGVLHSEQDFKSDNRQRPDPVAPGNFFAWDGSYAEPEWGAQSRYTTQSTKQTGVYAVTRLTLDDPLKLILGARVSNWTTNGMKWNGDLYGYEHKQVVSPYAGLTYDINDTYSTYVSYTDIFNPQDYQDRNGNHLDPLEGSNYEAGIKADYLNGRINASLALYRIEQDNLAQPDGDNLIPGTINQAYFGAQGTTSNGFEVELTGALTENWNMMVGWSQFKAEDARGAAVNTRFPRQTATLFTTYRMDDLTLGGGINWESSNYTFANNPLGQREKLKQDAYSLVNLMAKYQINPAMSLQLNLNNVLDKTYYSQIGFSNQFAYGAPRNAMLTLKYDF